MVVQLSGTKLKPLASMTTQIKRPQHRAAPGRHRSIGPSTELHQWDTDQKASAQSCTRGTHVPVGNCDEANLVSKMPAPSIKASSMPPIAAEPTMATGPSARTEEDST